METIHDYFQKAEDQAGSKNKLAAALKTTCGNITRIMSGAGFPGDETILRLAAYLHEDPQKLLLINQAERAPESARPVWTKLLKRFAGAAMIFVALSSMIPESLGVFAVAGETKEIYITRRTFGALRRALREFFLKAFGMLTDMFPQYVPNH